MRGRALARVRQARRNEDGAALVEFAIVSILLFTLLFGIVEFGLAFRDRLTMANASQSAARVLAALGNEDDSDFQALSSLATTLETLPNSGVDVVKYVDIYKADSDGNPVGSCPANEGPGDRCTRFLYDPVNYAPCNWEPCPDPAIDPLYDGAGWPFGARDVGVPDLDIAVVRVTFGHEWVTGAIVPLPDASCTSLRRIAGRTSPFFASSPRYLRHDERSGTASGAQWTFGGMRHRTAGRRATW